MITFQTEDIEMPAIQQEQVREWIKAVAATYGKRVGPISYFFCSDKRILEVNLEYLQHDYYTDIITFDYCEGNKLSGDIFISLMNKNCIASSFTASCTSAALTIKVLVNVKSWRLQKTKHWNYLKLSIYEEDLILHSCRIISSLLLK